MPRARWRYAAPILFCCSLPVLWAQDTRVYKFDRHEITIQPGCSQPVRTSTDRGFQPRVQYRESCQPQGGGLLELTELQFINLPREIRGTPITSGRLRLTPPIQPSATAKVNVAPMPALPKATWMTLRLGVWESNCAIALEPPVAPAGSTSRLLSGPKYYDMSQPPCRLESGLTRNDTFEIWTRYEASIGGGVDGWGVNVDIRTIYALQGSGGAAAPSVPPAATGPAAPVPLFVLSGVSCSSDPRETGSGGRVTCSATTVNRPAAGDPAVYEWRLDGRPVGGTGAVMTADGVPNGRHVITAVAANGGSRTPPFEVEVTVTGSPAAQPSSPPPVTVDVGGGTAPLPQNRPVKLQLTPEVRAAIVRAQCGNLDYLVLMVDVYRSRQDVDRGMIENLEATLIRDIRACVAKGQLPTEVGAAAGANRRSLPGSSGVAGRVTLQMASGAVRLTGRQTEVEWAVETPAGVALASGMAVFAASYSPPSRSVLLEAQSGPVRFIPAAPGAQPVIIQPGQSLQWPPAVPAATSGFDGVWATTWGDWGKITMWVTGNRITGWWGGDGSQATAGGTLEGTIDGRTARLRWKDRGTLWGGAMFTLSDDGNTLTGHRNDFKDPEVAMYKWNAQRVSSGR